MADQTLLEKAKALNPFGRVADVLNRATPKKAATPAKPVAPPTPPSGPNVLVDWVHPSTGKRMTTTAAERDAVLKPVAAKSLTRPRSLAKGGR